MGLDEVSYLGTYIVKSYRFRFSVLFIVLRTESLAKSED